MGLFRNPVRFLLFSPAIILFVASAPCRSDEIWGDDGSFPETIVKLLKQQARLTPKSTATSEVNEVAEDLTKVQKELEALISSVQGQRVRARLSVMEVIGDEVRLLPDVTYGFPTRRVEDIPEKYDWHMPVHSAVKLQQTGIAAPTALIVLKVGKDVEEALAKTLHWNDKLEVDFRVDSVEVHPFFGTKENESDAEPSGAGHTFCTVKFSDLRFLKADIDEVASVYRTWLWPGPGTLPYLLNSYAGGDGQGLVDQRNAFTDYASLGTWKGAAAFELRTTEAGQFLFWGQPLVTLDSRGEFILAPIKDRNILPLNDLKIPMNTFDRKEVKRIISQKWVLLFFDAKVIEGKEPVTNQYWQNQVIELSNFRLGTPEEHAATQQVLSTMEQTLKQYRLAVQTDKARRIAEKARLIAEARARDETLAAEKAAEEARMVAAQIAEDAAARIQQQAAASDAQSEVQKAREEGAQDALKAVVKEIRGDRGQDSSGSSETTASKPKRHLGFYIGGGIVVLGVLLYGLTFMLDVRNLFGR
jgi:hypothetical protein